MTDLPALPSLRRTLPPCHFCKWQKQKQQLEIPAVFEPFTSACCYLEYQSSAPDILRYEEYGKDSDRIYYLCRDVNALDQFRRKLTRELDLLHAHMLDMKLQIQVLMDMKRMGELDEKNGLYKRKRRDSV